jgi:hypothetical protein
MGRRENQYFQAFFLFAKAGLILEVIDEAKTGIEMHGAVELRSPEAVPLQILTG